ncbi:MAG: hypothetical protein AAFU64_16965 [Bacteroidota bacterium]
MNKQKEISIYIYNKREKSGEYIYVEQMGDQHFRMTYNAIFNCRLTRGTEFITKINAEGHHEVLRITQNSPYLTRRFFYPQGWKRADLEYLGEELSKLGGHWQVDFGGIVTVNYPPEAEATIEHFVKEYDFKVVELVED